MTARQIIEARLGRNLPATRQLPPDKCRTFLMP